MAFVSFDERKVLWQLSNPCALTNENFTFNPIILIFYCKFFC